MISFDMQKQYVISSHIWVLVWIYENRLDSHLSYNKMAVPDNVSPSSCQPRSKELTHTRPRQPITAMPRITIPFPQDKTFSRSVS